MKLRGTVCLVTGATSGIGRAAAVALAGAGARVVAVGRDEAALAGVADETGGRAVSADLSDRVDVGRAAAEARETFGRVDVLVNNAGIGSFGPFAEMDQALADRIVAVNLLAAIRLTRAVLPEMIERNRGRIVNVSSVAGHVGVPGEAVYAATKAALIIFSDSLRYELTGSGVGVTVISPGTVDTAFFERRGHPYERSFPKQIPAERVAAAVVRAVREDRDDMFVPAWGTLPSRLRGAFPGLYRFLAVRLDKPRY